jgi:hypothetical protein
MASLKPHDITCQVQDHFVMGGNFLGLSKVCTYLGSNPKGPSESTLGRSSLKVTLAVLARLPAALILAVSWLVDGEKGNLAQGRPAGMGFGR